MEPNNNKKGEYLLNKGIRISVDNVDGFAQVIENIFVSHDYTSKTIGELTNYNIRRTLLLAQKIITSPVIKIEDLIHSYLSGSLIITDFSIFMEALIKGNYEIYKKEDNHEIYPVFQANHEVRQSPLLKLRILKLLHSVHNSSRSIEKRHLEVQSIVDYFDSIGCPEIATDKALISLLEAGLIEPYDISSKDISSIQRLAISHRGIVHLRIASHNNIFFYQMALTTSITDEDIALKIKSVYKSNKSFQDKLDTIKKLFCDFLIDEDKQHISQYLELDQYKCQLDLIENIKRFTLPDKLDGPATTLGNYYRKGVIKEGVIAVVDQVYKSRGYGFVEVEDIEASIFLHLKRLKELGIEHIGHGDTLLCDLARGDQGFYIAKIHDIEINEVEVCVCCISRFFKDRKYGFVTLHNGQDAAFVHISLFPEERKDSIEAGQLFEAEVCADNKGDKLIVKQILSFIDSRDEHNHTSMKE